MSTSLTEPGVPRMPSTAPERRLQPIHRSVVEGKLEFETFSLTAAEESGESSGRPRGF